MSIRKQFFLAWIEDYFLLQKTREVFSAGILDLAYLTQQALAQGSEVALLSALRISGKGERTVSPTPVVGSHAGGPAGLFKRIAELCARPIRMPQGIASSIMHTDAHCFP